MVNIVDLKIDLDDPNSWITTATTLSNMNNLVDVSKRVGLMPITDQLTKIVENHNSRLPSVPDPAPVTLNVPKDF